MKYSPSTGGFYSPSIHKEIPEDAVDVSDETHESLLADQSAGKIIVAGEAGQPVAVDPTEIMSLAELQSFLLGKLSDERSTRESVFSFGGASMVLTRDTQNAIANAIQYLTLKGSGTVDWQAQRGVFVSFTLGQLQAMGVAAGDHVQACFTAAKVHAAAIAALSTTSAAQAYDLSSGWPG